MRKNKIWILIFLLTGMLSCNKEIKNEVYDQNTELKNFRETLNNLTTSIGDISPEIKNNKSLIKQFLNEDLAHQKMLPLISQTKKLLKSFELFENIENMLDNDEKKLIVAGIILYDTEKWRIENNGPIVNKVNLTTTPELERTEITKCISDAFGLGAGFSLIVKGATTMTIKGLVTLTISIYGRIIGWVGLAYTAYDLTMCLIEESKD
ncbi:MAG: hypothetical protein WCL56_08805 [Sediminibacterium sp.]